MGGFSEGCPWCDKWVDVRGALDDHVKAKHPEKLPELRIMRRPLFFPVRVITMRRIALLGNGIVLDEVDFDGTGRPIKGWVIHGGWSWRWVNGEVLACRGREPDSEVVTRIPVPCLRWIPVEDKQDTAWALARSVSHPHEVRIDSWET